MILDGYARIMAPFASWGMDTGAEPGGLGRFYCHFPVPWQLSKAYSNRGSMMDEDECELKERWERYVLGDEHYERQSREREEPLESNWLYNQKLELLWADEY